LKYNPNDKRKNIKVQDLKKVAKEIVLSPNLEKKKAREKTRMVSKKRKPTKKVSKKRKTIQNFIF
jgi:hypothetical protein